MRLAIGISLILVGMFWLAATFDLPQAAQSEAAHWKDAAVGTKWRRTAGGWQRVETVLPMTEQATPSALDPLVVAAFQLLVSVLALAVLPAGTKQRPTGRVSHPARAKTASAMHLARKTSRGVTC